MNREDILNLLKHLILQIRDDSKRLQSDPNLMKDWSIKAQMVKKEIESLNSCDALYVNDEYAKFFKRDIQPNISKLNSELIKQI